MTQRRRLIYYLLLNAFVSACVTGTILYFYDRAQGADCVPATAPTLPAVPSTVSGDIKIEIVSIVGAGMAASEVVVIQNKSEETIVLTGWVLQGDSGTTYTFPQLTLYTSGTVQVHTAAGTDTAVDLFWGRSAPIWKPGETATLKDAQGTSRATYKIP